MKNLKNIIYEVFILIQNFIMWIPFWPIRWFFLKMVLKSIGHHTYVARNVDIRKPSNIIIGNNCVINKNVLLDGRGGLLSIGNNVDIAQECLIWTLTHNIDSPTHSTVNNSTLIEDYVWLCVRSIILPGVSVHRGAVIGAGCVVHKDVDPLSVVVGNPSKVIKLRNNNLTYNLKHRKLFI